MSAPVPVRSSRDAVIAAVARSHHGARSRRAFLGLVVVLLSGGCAPSDAPAAAPTALTWPPRLVLTASGMPWQIQLDGDPDRSIPAPLYDLDPYHAGTAAVTALVRAGRRAVCHVDVAISDDDLPDAYRLAPAVGKPVAAGGSLRGVGATGGGGRSGPAASGRHWLDIRAWPTIGPVLADRFALCERKGFQAVDADGGDGLMSAQVTGFRLSDADRLTFDRRVAALAHAAGLAVAIRVRPVMAARVQPFTDFAITAGCLATPDCRRYLIFIGSGRAVLDVEAPGVSAAACGLAKAWGYATVIKPDVDEAAATRC